MIPPWNQWKSLLFPGWVRKTLEVCSVYYISKCTSDLNSSRILYILRFNKYWLRKKVQNIWQAKSQFVLIKFPRFPCLSFLFGTQCMKTTTEINSVSMKTVNSIQEETRFLEIQTESNWIKAISFEIVLVFGDY